MSIQQYVSIPEAGRMLGLSPKLVSKVIADEGMEVIRPSKQDRVRRKDVLDYRRRCQVAIEREQPKREYERVI
jgi:hypothetical protein